MRRAMSLKTTMIRLALAYALALQALLGTWAGASAAADQGFDPARSLCRTLAAGDTQHDDSSAIPGPHCALMCLSAACGAAGPPATFSVGIEFALLRLAGIIVVAVLDGRPASALGGLINARGPPQIA